MMKNEDKYIYIPVNHFCEIRTINENDFDFIYKSSECPMLEYTDDLWEAICMLNNNWEKRLGKVIARKMMLRLVENWRDIDYRFGKK